MAWIPDNSHIKVGDTVYATVNIKISAGTFTKGHEFIVVNMRDHQFDGESFEIRCKQGYGSANVDKRQITKEKPVNMTSSWYER